MRSRIAALTLGVLVAGVSANVANADVSGLSVRFGGGCSKDNTAGTCILKVNASGTELDAESVQLYTSTSQNGTYTRVSKRVKPLTASGQAQFRVPNVAGGCYKVKTGPNGDDKPDVTSRAKCE